MMSASPTANILPDVFTTTIVVEGTTYILTIATPSPESNNSTVQDLPKSCSCVDAQSLLEEHGLTQDLCDVGFIDKAEACLACFNETADASEVPELSLLQEALASGVEHCGILKSNSNNVGAVVGGTIGGIIAWLLLLGLVILLLRRRRGHGRASYRFGWSVGCLRIWTKAESRPTDYLPDTQELDGVSITRSLLQDKDLPVMSELPVNEEVRRPAKVDKHLAGLRSGTGNALSRAVSAPTLRS